MYPGQVLRQTDTLDLKYASQFSVTYYGKERYALITIGEDEKISGSTRRRAGARWPAGRYQHFL